jgi:G:T/U-mismatch repair DNA glycosylase
MSKSGQPYKFVSELRYETIIPYHDQLELLCSKGFAIWDVVGSCERAGSLDQNIKKEVPNDIIGFCEQHSHIQRIVIANGGTGSSMFLKHFRKWWLSGTLQPGENEESLKVFGKIDTQVAQHVARPISCVCAISVSPAAAKFNFQTKRDFWDKHVFQPGLALHQELQHNTQE